MTQPAPLLVPGLSALAPSYRAVPCDVWGVLHNGVVSFPAACEALATYRRDAGGTVVLITNSPRPAGPVVEQLAGFGVPREAYDDVVSSGDVTRGMIDATRDKPILHIGPARDHALFDGLDVRLVGEAEAEQVVCTGFMDDENETPDDYREQLARLVARGLPFLCANPDIVVERGDRLVWCAGALAQIYESYGGKVVYGGKPFPAIYALARNAVEKACGPKATPRLLAVGDGLKTDILGANNAFQKVNLQINRIPHRRKLIRFPCNISNKSIRLNNAWVKSGHKSYRAACVNFLDISIPSF